MTSRVQGTGGLRGDKDCWRYLWPVSGHLFLLMGAPFQRPCQRGIRGGGGSKRRRKIGHSKIKRVKGDGASF